MESSGKLLEAYSDLGEAQAFFVRMCLPVAAGATGTLTLTIPPSRMVGKMVRGMDTMAVPCQQLFLDSYAGGTLVTVTAQVVGQTYPFLENTPMTQRVDLPAEILGDWISSSISYTVTNGSTANILFTVDFRGIAVEGEVRNEVDQATRETVYEIEKGE